MSWRRSRVTVRPAEGWRADRVYRVELLPGVTDLRRNRSEEGKAVTLLHRRTPPTTTLAGDRRGLDVRPARPGALVVALLLPDSLPYRALADSSGHFSFGPLPAGDYLCSASWIRTGTAWPTFARHSTASAWLVGAPTPGELRAFVHDTTPPHIRTVTVGDSVSATIELSQPVDPRHRLAPESAVVALLPDSSPVPVVSAASRSRWMTASHRRGRREARQSAPDPQPDTLRADTVAPGPAPGRARADGRAQTEPLTSRPPLRGSPGGPGRPDLDAPGAKYAITLRKLRNVTGIAADAVGTLVVTRAAAPRTVRGGRRCRCVARPDPQPQSAGGPSGRPPTPSDEPRKPPAPTSP